MRPEKTQIIEELRGWVSASPFVLLADYTGLTVGQFTELRKRLKAVNAQCHVVKNSMLQRAMAAAGLPQLDGQLTGMTALVIGAGPAEVSAAAKVLKQFARESEKPKFKMGVLGQRLLQPEEVTALADLPSLNELRAQLVGLLQTPATRLAVVLGAPAAGMARVLKAHADKKQGAAPAAVPA